jgi:hypothetical protein
LKARDVGRAVKHCERPREDLAAHDKDETTYKNPSAKLPEIAHKLRLTIHARPGWAALGNPNRKMNDESQPARSYHRSKCGAQAEGAMLGEDCNCARGSDVDYCVNRRGYWVTELG